MGIGFGSVLGRSIWSRFGGLTYRDKMTVMMYDCHHYHCTGQEILPINNGEH